MQPPVFSNGFSRYFMDDTTFIGNSQSGAARHREVHAKVLRVFSDYVTPPSGGKWQFEACDTKAEIDMFRGTHCRET